MNRMSRFRKSECRGCGKMISRNALGRAAHARACPGRQQTMPEIKHVGSDGSGKIRWSEVMTKTTKEGL